MAPVASVCPVHGAFASRGIEIFGARNATLSQNSETCPMCGRPAAVMDGVFNFDADGFAEIVNAPGWSRDALQAVQARFRRAGEVLKNDTVPDAEAYRRLEAEIAGLRQDLAASRSQSDANNQRQDERMEQLIGVVEKVKPTVGRKKLAAILLGIAAALGLVSDVGGGVEYVGDAFRWAIEQAQAD